MGEPSEPRHLEEMTEEERIEVADKAAIFKWFEEQTKGIPIKRRKQKIENYKKVLDELFDRLPRWKVE